VTDALMAVTSTRTFEPLPLLETEEDPLLIATQLFDIYLIENSSVSIERQYSSFGHTYIFRMLYVSKNSGRSMSVMAKGDRLPKTHDDLFKFYLRQLLLTPKEVAKYFSRLDFLERRARQDAFLAGDRSVRVSDKTAHKDKLDYEDYI